jgi:multidrug efflux pump subunit AcrA (membrane-fusion protein)
MPIPQQLVDQANQIQKNKQEAEAQRLRLEQYKKEAQQVQGEKIPQRRFGGNVTKQTQQQYLQRQQQAQSNLQAIQSEKQSLENYNQQLSSAQEEVKYAIDYEQGKHMRETGGMKYSGMTPGEKAGYEAGVNEEFYYEQRAYTNEDIKNLANQGFKPVYSYGAIVGIEDVQKGISYSFSNNRQTLSNYRKSRDSLNYF